MSVLRIALSMIAALLLALAAPASALAQSMYVGASTLNVRSGPGQEFEAVGRLRRGAPVAVSEQQDGWAKVEADAASGWVASRYLSDTPPAAPARALRAAGSRSSTGSGGYRAPSSGRCDCPYHTDRAGRRCGARSAYSRPGGRSPRCY